MKRHNEDELIKIFNTGGGAVISNSQKVRLRRVFFVSNHVVLCRTMFLCVLNHVFLVVEPGKTQQSSVIMDYISRPDLKLGRHIINIQGRKYMTVTYDSTNIISIFSSMNCPFRPCQLLSWLEP